MGTKGAKDSEAGRRSVEMLVGKLEPLGPVTSKKMFGGYGVFLDGVMFAMVDSTGGCLLRADDLTTPDFDRAGSQRHGRMPYWSIPDDVLADDEALVTWAGTAHAAALRAK